MRPSVKSGPVNLTGVLALEEEGLGLAVLEAEDLAVTTDVELALYMPSVNAQPIVVSHHPPPGLRFVVSRERNIDIWRRRTSGHGAALSRTLPG